MSKTHWKALGDASQYLGKQHFGPDEKKTVTIEMLEEETVENAKKRTKEIKRVLHFKEPDVRPLILNATNGERIEKLLGTPYYEDWKDKQIILWVDPTVPNNFDPEKPGAVRVWKTLPVVKTAICENCGCVIEPYEIGGKTYSVNKIIKRSNARFGETLCWDCSIAKMEADDEQKTVDPV